MLVDHSGVRAAGGRRRLFGVESGALLMLVAAGVVPASAAPARPFHVEKPGPNTIPATLEVPADVETEPVAGDADDMAIWVHPTDPSRSVLIGTDKLGALETYDLSGRRLQTVDPGLVPTTSISATDSPWGDARSTSSVPQATGCASTPSIR